jgi:hypothetical protein
MGVSMGCCASRRLLDHVYCRSVCLPPAVLRLFAIAGCCLACRFFRLDSLQPNQCQLATRRLAAYAVPVAGPLLLFLLDLYGYQYNLN